jgi:hypothetical protein
LALQGLPFTKVNFKTERLASLSTSALCDLAGNAFSGFACLAVFSAMLATVDLVFAPLRAHEPEPDAPMALAPAVVDPSVPFVNDLVIDAAASSQGSLFDSQV